MSGSTRGMPRKVGLAALVGVLVAATFSPVANAAEQPGAEGGAAVTPTFSDIAGNEHEAAIKWLAEQGLTTGYLNGTYRPLGSVNRDAMAAFIYRLAGEPDYTPPSVSPFSDVPTSMQFYKEMAWLNASGIATGFNDGTYRPLASVNRDAMAAFMNRYSGTYCNIAVAANFPAPIAAPFADVPVTLQFSREIAWMKDSGISRGWTKANGTTTFRPVVPVARDAMAAFIQRLDVYEEANGGCQPDPSDERPWMNPDLPADQRAGLLLGAMTLDEKVKLMRTEDSAPSSWYNEPIARLGIPGLTMGDAASGIGSRGWALPGTGDVATSFPQEAGVAATWDPELAYAQGQAVGLEGKLTGHDMVLGPGADIVRNPHWGRVAETLSEDPKLNSELATKMVQGIESQGTMASLKHFVGNARENNRGGINSVIDERALREVHALPFENVVRDANPATVMCAFNKINGDHACDNKTLLNDLLREDFGFDGFVLTDTQAVKDTVKGVTAGTDLETGGGYRYGQALAAAVRDGRVPETLVDRSVVRILTTMFRFGLFERPESETGPLPVEEHRQLSKEINTKAIALLKNDGALPLAEGEVDSIALIGADAQTVTSPTAAGVVKGIGPVSILDGMRARAEGSGIELRYEEGNDPVGGASMLEPADMTTVPSSVLSPETGEGNGLTARHFGNRDLQGEPRVTRTERQVAYDAGFVGCAGVVFAPICGWSEGGTVPIAGSNPIGGGQSATWDGYFTAPTTGTYRLGMTGYGTGTVTLDGKDITTMAGGVVQDARSEPLQLVAGEQHKLRVTFRSTNPVGIDAGVGLLTWQTPEDTVYPAAQRAAEAAAASDAAVVVVRPAEGENRDRLSLKAAQNADALVRAVTAANPNTIVVVASGGPVTMPWLDEVPAVVWNPYGGQEEGSALASILFGDESPSGHLPVTWPRSDNTVLPGVENPFVSFYGPDDVFAEGINVGYRGYLANNIQPLFSFGHGLSYTDFTIDNVNVGESVDTTGGSDGSGGKDTVDVQLRLRNTGDRTGAEVVQVYLGGLPGVDSPPLKLAGFAKVELDAGEGGQVKVTLDRKDFSYWDADADAWVSPAGDVAVYVGTSATEVQQAGTVKVIDNAK